MFPIVDIPQLHDSVDNINHDLFDVYSFVSPHKAVIYNPCTITNIGTFPTVTVDILSYYQALGYNINNYRTTSCRTMLGCYVHCCHGHPNSGS